MGYQGNIRIADAHLTPTQAGKYATRIEHMPGLFSPTPERRGYYHRNAVFGRKFYYNGKRSIGKVPVEVCPEGSRFDLRLSFTNLATEELGLLLIALGLSENHPFRLKIGGAKPACFGTILVTADQMLASSSAASFYLDLDRTDGIAYEGPALAQFVQHTIAASLANTDVIVAEQLQSVTEILRYPNERDCPSGPY
jgi:hypothetical protein